MSYHSGEEGLERAVQQIGARLHDVARGARPSLFDLRGVRGRLLGAALQDEGLRSALFQFVDVLPALDTPESISAHFHAYLHDHRLGGVWGKLLEFGEHPWAAWAVRRSVRRLARQFLVEEEPDAVKRVVDALARLPASVTMDAVGEAVLTETESDAYLARNLDLLRWLAQAGARPPHLSVKLSALTARFDPIDPEGTAQRVLARIEPLLREVEAAGAALTVDMESHELKPLTLDLFRRIAGRRPGRHWLPGIALQAYCPDTERDLRALIDWARNAGRRVSVRLVKGAYRDTEVALAVARGWPCPVYQCKDETDAAFERLTGILFRNADLVYPAIASHNLRSLAHAIAAAGASGLSAEQWEVQMLYGMAEPLRDALATLGVRLRVYVPSGDLLTGIAYLIRRLMENTADTSVLRQAYVENADPAVLLAPPHPHPLDGISADASPVGVAQATRLHSSVRSGRVGATTRRQSGHPAGSELAHMPFEEEEEGGGAACAPENAFSNIPLTDFSLAENRAAFARGLATARAALGRFHPLAVPGASADGVVRANSRNPASPRELLAEFELAGPTQAEHAVVVAQGAFPAWRDTPTSERARLCQRAAGILLERRHELAAWEVLETGKNWREADADVAETIDYLRYYAAEMMRLDGRHPTRCFPAERNERRYESCGVAVIIAPWNFPLAILAGMSAAALVTGNTAIMKPAGPARLCAQHFWEVLMEAGVPREVCQCLPGSGEVVGETLVAHPDTHIIAFTGSREVGLGILQRAHTPSPAHTHVKRVVCEMGGKNAIVVDEDADLDEAVAQVLASTFGYQGQKCSACSRLIAVGAVHDRLVARLAEALEACPMGPPEDPHYVLGPLISAAAKEKAERYLEIGRDEGRLYYQGRAPDGGHYFAPAIFTGIGPRHRLAREEIFAPILAVLRAGSFEQALDMALDSDYALTGGVFSRLPEHLGLARERFRVGNLYLNRKITGALVAVQPFGGWRLSGTGIQAGGPDYLKQFLWSRVVSENTLRHGFVP